MLEIHISFNSFQLGFRRTPCHFFFQEQKKFQFLLVRLQTEQAQSICEWVCVVSIPFSQALDTKYRREVKMKSIVSIPFSQALDREVNYVSIFFIFVVSIPFSQALDSTVRGKIRSYKNKFQFLLVRLQTLQQCFQTKGSFWFQFLLVRLQTE